MPSANVSSEALSQAKLALESFASSMSGFSRRAASQLQTCEQACKSAEKQTDDVIQKLTFSAASLNAQIEKAERRAAEASRMIERAKTEIESAKSHIDGLRCRRESLNEHIFSLRNALIRAGDEERQILQRELSCAESELRVCENNISNQERKVADCEDTVRVQSSLREEAKRAVSRCEGELSEVLSRKSQYEAKLDRLKSLGASLVSEMSFFADASRAFETKALDNARGTSSALGACLECVNAYETAL